jgi:C4-dicarboxylate transporter DctQ subunit
MFTKIVHFLEETILAFLLAAMTLITFAEVVARYVFNTGAVWSLELTIFLFAWLVLLGMSYGVRVGAHIGVDLLPRTLPPGVQKTLALIAIVLCMAYAAIMFRGGWDTVALLLMIGIEAEDVPIPLWIPTLVLPLGFALLFLRFAEVGWKLLTGRAISVKLADEAQEAIEKLRQDQPGKK